MIRLLLLSLPVAGLLLPGCFSANSESDSDSVKKEEKINFITQVMPILEERCVMCHNAATLPDHASFETAALAREGDKKGPVIIPGKPEASRLLLSIAAADIHEHAMPPVSKRITKKEIAILTQWIREGADWPEGEAGRIVPPFIPKE